MASTKYTYSIANNTLNGIVNPDLLSTEIRSSSITIALDYLATANDDLDIWMKAPLSSGEELTLNNLVANHTGAANPPEYSVPVDATGQLVRTETNKGHGSSSMMVSHNYTDPCTWYTESGSEVSGSLTWNGSYYDSPHINWIDVNHRRITDEQKITGYDVNLWVDGELKEEDVDYTVIYESGLVAPLTWTDAGQVVQATYNYASGSSFFWQPLAGKKLILSDTEIQRSMDLNLSQQSYGYFEVEYNHPQYGWVVANQRRYGSYRDFINTSNKNYPLFPADSEVDSPIQVLRWDYATFITLPNENYRIRVRIDNDTPYQGTHFVVTLYALFENATS